MKLKPELIITLVILVVEVAVVVICRIMLKRPADPLRPRIVPYGAIMMFVSLGIFLTIAHTVSLVTGQQLLPKRMTPGQTSR